MRHAALRPDAPAVTVRGVTRSYVELQDTASRWANAILGASKKRPERIGLFAYRSEVSYAGTLAASIVTVLAAAIVIVPAIWLGVGLVVLLRLLQRLQNRFEHDLV